ncbi:MAG: FtsQ-type POTRA domain-containing protein [FCB group bacterium]|jgi:cell division septal protein FtsQ
MNKVENSNIQPIEVKSKKSRLFIQLLLLLVALSSLVLLSSKWDSKQPVTNIKIIGNKIITEKEIKEKIFDVQNNNTLQNPNLSEILKKVSSIPFIKSAYIYRKNSNEIDIEIKERTPIAIIVNTQGELALVDDNCNILPYRIYSDFPDLPLLRGLNPGGKIDDFYLNEAIKIIEILKNNKNRILDSFISEIIFDSENKSFKILASDFGLDVYLGDPYLINEKIENLLSWWQDNFTKDELSKIQYIDLRWTDQVVVQYKQMIQVKSKINEV